MSRPYRRRRPSSRDDGGGSGLFSSGGPSVRFLHRYDARSVSLSWGGKEVGSPCEWRRGARLYSQVIVGESGLDGLHFLCLSHMRRTSRSRRRLSVSITAVTSLCVFRSQ